MPSQPKTRQTIKQISAELPLDEMLSRVAEGATQRDLAALVSQRTGKPISVYYLNRWIHDSPERAEAWKAAKSQAADRFADVVAETIGQVKDGTLDPNQAKVISSNAQWLASRMAPAKWGDRIQVDAQVLDVTQLHLDQLRSALRTVSTVDKSRADRE